jgi:hypothetical protein
MVRKHQTRNLEILRGATAPHSSMLTHRPGMTSSNYGRRIAAPVVALPSSSVCARAASFSA